LSHYSATRAPLQFPKLRLSRLLRIPGFDGSTLKRTPAIPLTLVVLVWPKRRGRPWRDSQALVPPSEPARATMAFRWAWAFAGRGGRDSSSWLKGFLGVNAGIRQETGRRSLRSPAPGVRSVIRRENFAIPQQTLAGRFPAAAKAQENRGRVENHKRCALPKLRKGSGLHSAWFRTFSTAKAKRSG